MRHRLLLTAVDLCLVTFAVIGAQFLRDNFETRPEQLVGLLPYLTLTLVLAVPVLVMLGLNRSIWRMSAMPDYLRIASAVALIVTSAVALGFLINRLEGVARSLPIIEAGLLLLSMVGVRVVAVLRHAKRRPVPAVRHVAPSPSSAPETILLVGINRITELYLRCVADFGARQVRVAGLVDPKQRHIGRLVQEHKVLGGPEQIAGILRDLEVHGVLVDRIVVTIAFAALSPAAQMALLAVEKSSTIKLEFFAENIGIIGRREPADLAPAPKSFDEFSIPAADELQSLARRPYWRVKRALDATVALCVLIVAAPVILLVAALVAIDVGLPLIFWQWRPGAGGHPFRLLKFRTMGAPHDWRGQRIADVERLSRIGRFLRRSRFDELPQLFNILIGEMSFVGPRPLLPADQFPALATRLAIPPGLTGWAQIKGGRELTAADKAALDVWYVKHASLRIDLEIVAGTLRMLLFGDCTNPHAIGEAWRELGRDRLVSDRPIRHKKVDGDKPVLSLGGRAGMNGAEQPCGAPQGTVIRKSA